MTPNTTPRAFKGSFPKPEPKEKNLYVGIRKVSLKKQQEIKEGATQKAEQDLWFRIKVKECKGTCKHCGVRFNPCVFNIAHILPKRPDYGFPSVATHRLNWVELCGHCHADFDNLIIQIENLECWPEILKKFLAFYPDIDKSERARIPESLLQYIQPV